MGYLKGKGSLMKFDWQANLKYKYINREFWCRGYYVDTVGRNKKHSEIYSQWQQYSWGSNDHEGLFVHKNPD